MGAKSFSIPGGSIKLVKGSSFAAGADVNCSNDCCVIKRLFDIIIEVLLDKGSSVNCQASLRPLKTAGN